MGFWARLLAGLLVLVLVLWAGTQAAMLLAARRMAAGGRLDMQQAAMLADPGRIGIGLSGVTWRRNAGDRLEMSELTLWLPPWALNAPHVALPAETRQIGAPGQRVIAIDAGQMQARFSPFRRLALTEGRLALDALRIDGAPLLGRTRLDLHLTNYGAQVPPPAVRAAYRLDLALEGIDLPEITRRWEIGEASGETPGQARVTGPVQLWLDRAIGPREAQAPGLEAVILDGLAVEIDGQRLLIWGRLQRDADGIFGGEIALDMADLRGFVVAAGHAGLFPTGYAHLAATALETVADEAAGEPEGPAAPVSSPDLRALRAGLDTRHIPPRPEGMRRVPVRLAAGQIHVGNLPLSALLTPGGPDAAALPD